MRPDLQTLLRGLLKLVAVAVVAGLAGAGIGVALGSLSGSDDGGDQVLPAAAGRTAATVPATTAVSPQATSYVPPGVEVISALIGPPSPATGRALVAAKVRVTNRTGRAIDIARPALLSGQDEIAANAWTSARANPLQQSLARGARMTGTVRFTLTPEVTRRLDSTLSARLRIARRTVLLKLTKG